MLKIRRPLGRLIFNMGIAIPGKTVFLIETAPWWLFPRIYCLNLWVKEGSHPRSWKARTYILQTHLPNTKVNVDPWCPGGTYKVITWELLPHIVPFARSGIAEVVCFEGRTHRDYTDFCELGMLSIITQKCNSYICMCIYVCIIIDMITYLCMKLFWSFLSNWPIM